MNERSIQRYERPELPAFLRPVAEIIDEMANQAIQHPYKAAGSSAIAVGVAARGFGVPGPACVGLRLITFALTSEGLGRQR